MHCHVVHRLLGDNNQCWPKNMLDYREIQIAAKHWIERHGPSSIMQLQQRLVELDQHNQSEAHALWLQILAEVKLQIKQPETND